MQRQRSKYQIRIVAESHPPLGASVCRMSRRLQRQTRLMRPIKRNPSGRRFTISLREFKSAVPVQAPRFI